MTSAVDVDTIARLRTCLIQISRRIDRQASAGGLTSTEASVLAAIAHRGPVGLGDLAASQGETMTQPARFQATALEYNGASPAAPSRTGQLLRGLFDTSAREFYRHTNIIV